MRRLDELGDPALCIGGFRLWVHGLPSAEGWLDVTAVCEAPGARVWVEGAILTVADVERFGVACAGLLRGGQARAQLCSVEPELRAELDTVDNLGHLRLRVQMSPRHDQEHRMELPELDQSFLAGVVAACAAIVSRAMRERP